MLNVELNGTEPEHVGRITPKISVDTQGNVTWVPSLLDHNAKIFYRGKTVTNEEFNELFLKQVYSNNYVTDSLNVFFNKHLSNVINRKFRNDFKLVKSFVQPFTSEDWGEQQEDGYYYITIPASVHGFELDTESSDNALESVNIDIEMYLLDSEGLFYEVTQANIGTDNTVVLYTDDVTVPGFIVIRSNDKSYALVDVRINVDQIDNIADVAKTGKYADLIDLDAADGPNTRINKNEKDIIAILTGVNDDGDTVAAQQAINAVESAYAKNVTDTIRNIPISNIFEGEGTSYVVKEARLAHNYSNTGSIANQFNSVNTNINSVNTNLTNNINNVNLTLTTAVTNIQNGNTAVGKANNIKDKNGNFNTLQTALLNMVYPVGSVYISVNNVNPGAFLGGKWTALPAGKALWTVPSSGEYAQANKEIPAGIPNIKGRVDKLAMDISNSTSISKEGCFNTSEDGGAGNADGTGTNVVNIIFNANEGATTKGIYRDDVNTVQPPAYTVYAWRRYE